jgi:hypothetical protein
LVLLLAGCADKRLQPFLGTWRGGFYPVAARGTANQTPEWAGYLQLYMTHAKCILHLENASSNVDVTGTWQLKKERILVTATSIDLDTREGALSNNADAKLKLADQIRTDLKAGVILQVEENGTKLQGLDMHLGPDLGHLELSKSANDVNAP